MKAPGQIAPDTYDPLALALLEKIKTVPPRDEDAARNGRDAFLARAQQLRPTRLEKRAWWQTPGNRTRFWGLNPALLGIILLIFVLASTTTTVYAAQTSAPDHFLYPVKLASEDIRISLAPNSQDVIDMDMQFASRRFEEIGEMLEQNKKAPDSVATRWQGHIHDLFEHSSQLSEAQFQQIMEQARLELTQQLNYINTLLLERPGDAALLKLHSEVSASLRLVENGIKDPQSFRLNIKTAEGKEIEQEVENESREHEEQETDEHSQPVFSPSATSQNFNLTPQATIAPTVSGEEKNENETEIEETSASQSESESGEEVNSQTEDNTSEQNSEKQEESHHEDQPDSSEHESESDD